MKFLATFAFTLTTLFASATGPKSVAENTKATQSAYDMEKGSWEQPNPIFRWPLPTVQGDVYINVQFVWIGVKNESVLEETKAFLNNVYNVHGIYLSYEETAQSSLDPNTVAQNWKSVLPEQDNKITLYILPFEEGSELERRRLYASNGIATSRALVPYHNAQEFKVFTAKNLGHMLGLLPTYFENQGLSISAENADNCGNAGDFVCDTPSDYLGLKNDVKQKNCKYKGKVGEPNPGNIMSNSWSHCMDHITPEQANKIKYNLSVIPELQQTLSDHSTIAMNIDEETFNGATQSSIK